MPCTNALILSLLARGRPSTVVGSVVAVRVDAIERFAGRARTHVFEEMLEFLPAAAEANPSSAVVLVRGVSAAATHCHPRHVLARHRDMPFAVDGGPSRRAVRRLRGPDGIGTQAPATRATTTPQVRRGDCFRNTAIAKTGCTSAPIDALDRDNEKAAESLADVIQQRSTHAELSHIKYAIY